MLIYAGYNYSRVLDYMDIIAIYLCIVLLMDIWSLQFFSVTNNVVINMQPFLFRSPWGPASARVSLGNHGRH